MTTFSISLKFNSIYGETDDLLKKHFEVTWDTDIDTVLFPDLTEKFLYMYETVRGEFYGY